MEITQGNLAALFQGLRGTFRDTLNTWKDPESERFAMPVNSTTHTEQYPSVVLLGDLEKLLDEVAKTNIADFIQSVENVDYARAVEIPRANLEDDSIGMYTPAVQTLARLAASHPYRMLPYLFVSSDGTATGGQAGGFQTAWVDGANQFSNIHVWPGGQGWDNLDEFPLTAANFGIAIEHLESRLGPHGRPLGLRAKVLVVGPSYDVAARTILQRQLIGGGDTNIWYGRTDLVVWHAITDLSWFVIDDSGLFGKPCVVQNRTGPEFTALTNPTDEPVFRRHVFEYQAQRRYGEAMVCPWTVQAVAWASGQTTSTVPD